jgi:hypothetical protein
MADAQDLKSWGPLKGRVGSSPTTGTTPKHWIAKEFERVSGFLDSEMDTKKVRFSLGRQYAAWKQPEGVNTMGSH